MLASLMSLKSVRVAVPRVPSSRGNCTTKMRKAYIIFALLFLPSHADVEMPVKLWNSSFLLRGKQEHIGSKIGSGFSSPGLTSSLADDAKIYFWRSDRLFLAKMGSLVIINDHFVRLESSPKNAIVEVGDMSPTLLVNGRRIKLQRIRKGSFIELIEDGERRVWINQNLLTIRVRGIMASSTGTTLKEGDDPSTQRFTVYLGGVLIGYHKGKVSVWGKPIGTARNTIKIDQMRGTAVLDGSAVSL